MSDEGELRRLAGLIETARLNVYRGQAGENLDRTEDWTKVSLDDVHWLCDRLLEAWGVLADMQQDEGYRRGVREGLRRAATTARKERDGYNVPQHNTMFAQGRKTGHLDMVMRIENIEPREPPLPPDRLLAEYERMRAALRKVLYEVRIIDLNDGNKVMYCERIAREALGEEE